ncbi:MAG: hemerythrin domain-containing protein [Polyangiaceae bacterium]
MANANQPFSKGYEMKAREKFAKAEGAVKSAGSRVQGDPTVFRRLKREHGEMDNLMKQILGADVAVRISLFPKLARELRAHGYAEEQSVYRRLGRLGATREICASSSRTHGDLDALLGTLERADFDSPKWMEDFKLLMKVLERHVREEEDELMPHAQELLDEAELAAMDAAYVAAKDLVKPN